MAETFDEQDGRETREYFLCVCKCVLVNHTARERKRWKKRGGERERERGERGGDYDSIKTSVKCLFFALEFEQRKNCLF